jgi:hypothetical protein
MSPHETPSIEVAERQVRCYTVSTGTAYETFLTEWELAVPAVSEGDVVALASAGGWEAVRAFSDSATIHGFMRFHQIESGPLMRIAGNSRKAVTYLVGSLILGEQLYRHDPGVLLYAPLRTAIAEQPDGSAAFSFDKPVDLFASFERPVISEAAAVFERRFASLLKHLNLPLVPEINQE